MIIWADEDGSQGDHHANFKLSRSGEFLGLFYLKEQIFFPVDTMTFPEQETDISYGRIPNGSGDFKFLDFDTPGYNNETSSSIDLHNSIADLKITPNPAIEKTYISLENNDSEISKIELLDLTGRVISTHSGKFNKGIEIDRRQIGSGVFLVRITDSFGFIHVGKLIML